MRSTIRTRRGRKKIHKDFELQLTSMMDILVIILVFLLKSYTVSTNSFSSVPGIQIPISKTQELTPDSLHLIVTPDAITFENQRVVEFVKTVDSLEKDSAKAQSYAFKNEDLDEGGMRIARLYDALNRAREKAELLRAQSTARDQNGNPLPFDGIIAIQADKRVKYDTLRKIMYTAGAAQFRIFRLLAMRQDQ
ncbi:MAG: biopolymer transporter ExbD [Bdellovibrionales bacterium]|nr:biopolymer transporter ExbD [Bdellovibrionales bacterium]